MIRMAKLQSDVRLGAQKAPAHSGRAGRERRIARRRSGLTATGHVETAWTHITSGKLECLRPYGYHLFLLVLIPIALWLDIHTQNVAQQDLLGGGAFAILVIATRFSSPAERRQVWIMVGVATCVEVWSSLIWGVYRYRFGNVPLFVPWGHGLVYLFALRAARTPLLVKYGKHATRLAFGCATAWMVFGITIEPVLLGRIDVLGALWWPVLAYFMRKPSAPIFSAAFFVTSVLELVGTHFGNWAWAVYTPISHIPSGNPPSVISAGYCLMDFTSITIAASLPAGPLLPALLARLRPRVPGLSTEPHPAADLPADA
jgi:hypothetical protein